MGNPLFNRFGGGIPQQNANPMVGALSAIKAYREIQNDPSKICDLLLQRGKITQNQYNEMKKLNGNPELMARYLMQSGTLTQQDINNIKSTL